MINEYAVGWHGGSLTALPARARTAIVEVEVASRLLVARDDYRPWTRAALECAVGGNPLDVSDALSNLSDAGIIRLSEERVTLLSPVHDLMLYLGLRF